MKLKASVLQDDQRLTEEIFDVRQLSFSFLLIVLQVPQDLQLEKKKNAGIKNLFLALTGLIFSVNKSRYTSGAL